MKTKNAIVVFLVMGFITLQYMGWMARQLRPLTSREVVAFEFAGSAMNAREFLKGIGGEKVALMEKSLYLDFGFLVLYSFSIALGCRVVPLLTGKSNWITRQFPHGLLIDLLAAETS